MKKNKKLILNKSIVSKLNSDEANQLRGGDLTDITMCVSCVFGCPHETDGCPPPPPIPLPQTQGWCPTPQTQGWCIPC
jgi:natural product precursor